VLTRLPPHLETQQNLFCASAKLKTLPNHSPLELVTLHCSCEAFRMHAT
jgi:hypothetical protein